MDKEAQEKIVDEDTSKVLVSDLPRQEEYNQIIYDAQDVGKYSQSDFAKSQEANRKAWSGITNLMAQCIARGMRIGYRKPPDRPELEKELKDKIVTLAVGIMIIVGKLKPEDLEEADKDKFEQVCKAIKNEILALIPDELPKDKPPLLTPALAHELGGTIPEFQDRLAWLLNYASAMGDYGDPHGILAVLSPQSGKVLVRESEVHTKHYEGK